MNSFSQSGLILASFACLAFACGGVCAEAEAAGREERVGGQPATPSSEPPDAELFDAWRKAADSEATPILNFTLPLASHPSGRIKVLLHAEEAKIPAEGIVSGHGLVVELYDEGGALESLLIAGNFLYDHRIQRGYCEGKVRALRKSVQIEGRGMIWLVKEQTVKILSDAVVLYSNKIVPDMGFLL